MRLIHFAALISLACTTSKHDNLAADTSGAQTTARTSDSASHITPPSKPIERMTLLSPGGGDTLVEGRTYIIRWTPGPARHINIGAAMGGHDKGLLLNNAPAHPDSMAWKVPIGFVTGFGPASSDQIRLRIENADSTDQYVESKPFVIMGAATGKR